MNIVLLIFVILAATFISGSANNLLTVSSALDHLFDRAKLEYFNTLMLSTLGGIKVLDAENWEITKVNDGEIYVTGFLSMLYFRR